MLKICWLPVLVQRWKPVLYKRSTSLSFRLFADSQKLVSSVGSTLVRLLISAWVGFNNNSVLTPDVYLLYIKKAIHLAAFNFFKLESIQGRLYHIGEIGNRLGRQSWGEIFIFIMKLFH